MKKRMYRFLMTGVMAAAMLGMAACGSKTGTGDTAAEYPRLLLRYWEDTPPLRSAPCSFGAVRRASIYARRFLLYWPWAWARF